jgi:hypothetical protein
MLYAVALPLRMMLGVAPASAVPIKADNGASREANTNVESNTTFKSPVLNCFASFFDDFI